MDALFLSSSSSLTRQYFNLTSESRDSKEGKKSDMHQALFAMQQLYLPLGSVNMPTQRIWYHIVVKCHQAQAGVASGGVLYMYV